MANKHRKIAGALYIVHGLLCLFVTAYIVSTLWNLFSMAMDSGDANATRGVYIGVGTIALSFALCAFQAIAGIVVLRRADNVKRWGIAGAILGTPSGPFGLIIAVYGLWVFLRGSSESKPADSL